MKAIRTLLMGLIAVVSASAAAFAQSDYPNQRVTIIVPFGAGSVTDIMARIVADDLGRRWNQQVIVENRPGLPGTVAAAKATPDGYTLMLTSNGHTVTGLVNKNSELRSGEGFFGHHTPVYLTPDADHASGCAGKERQGSA